MHAHPANASLEKESNRFSGVFPHAPASWFHFCLSRELNQHPIDVEVGRQRFVGYRTASGRAAVLSGRCSHLGARLANGVVKGERLVCPLHGWEYGPNGGCESIPSGEPIPGFARQCSYPVSECGGHVFLFNRSQALFPLPFFDEMSPDELLPAPPFELLAEAPWFFVGANGFDLQHFRMAHDRTLIGEPDVSMPSPYARRIVAKFAVAGHSWQDRLTRRIAGPQVTMDVTSWCGTMILVRATFQRTTTFGLFNVLPLESDRTLGRVIVWVRRSQNLVARTMFDSINAMVRRFFIQTFLRSDLPRIAGLRYQPGHLIAADRVMAGYLKWLETITAPSTLESS